MVRKDWSAIITNVSDFLTSLALTSALVHFYCPNLYYDLLRIFKNIEFSDILDRIFSFKFEFELLIFIQLSHKLDFGNYNFHKQYLKWQLFQADNSLVRTRDQ